MTGMTGMTSNPRRGSGFFLGGPRKVVVVIFMEAYHLCSMFFIPCACRFQFHNNLWPVNCHSDLKKIGVKKTVKLPKLYCLVSTKRYRFGSFTYTGVGDKLSETVTVSEKRLMALVFSPETVPFCTV